MPRIEGFTATSRAPRYLAQLCKHLTHRGMQVDNDDESGFVDFGFGNPTLQTQPQGLVISVETTSPVTLDRVQQRLTADIERFGRRDGLTITWNQTMQE